MIPNQTFAAFPEFANSGTKTKPDDAKYAAGFAPADVLPAEWTNYFWAGSTKGITDLNAGVTSLEAEVNNVLTNRGIEASADNNAQLLAALQSFKAEAILAAHPVGSLYWTSSTENPAVTFGGGTWTQIKDKFILAAGDTYANGATGGAATVTLTAAQMPSHNHGGSTGSGGVDHTHTTNAYHRHYFSGSTSGINGTYTGTMRATNKLYGDGIVNGSTTGTAQNWGIAVNGNSQSNILKFDISSHGHSCAGWDNAYIYNYGQSAVGSAGTWNITSGGASQYSHTHSISSSGSGNAHNNMPPYIVKYCWERTA